MSKLTAEELVERTLDGAYALALQLAGNSSDAWDLAQEALLRAVRSLPGFRGESDPKTWVYRIVVNVWKNKMKSRAWRWWRGLSSLGPDMPEPASQEPPLDRGLQRQEELEALERCLAALEPEDRAALVLRELDGKSYEEISGILAVPMGTVKSRLYRARSALARLLEKHDAA